MTPPPGPRTDPMHSHDLRIGAREYENGTVRAWQVYCVICDQAGRIILAIEAEAAGAPLREALSVDTAKRAYVAVQGNPTLDQWAEAFVREYAALTAQPAPEPFYDSDGIPIPDELFAGLVPAPAPLDVEALPDALAIVFADLENTPGPVFGSYWQDRADALRIALAEIASEVHRLTARAAATEDTDPDKEWDGYHGYGPTARAAATEPKEKQ